LSGDVNYGEGQRRKLDVGLNVNHSMLRDRARVADHDATEIVSDSSTRRLSAPTQHPTVNTHSSLIMVGRKHRSQCVAC